MRRLVGINQKHKYVNCIDPYVYKELMGGANDVADSQSASHHSNNTPIVLVNTTHHDEWVKIESPVLKQQREQIPAPGK
jgi:UDP-N-acetyl-D-mannosaminuronate dehydrogenase